MSRRAVGSKLPPFRSSARARQVQDVDTRAAANGVVPQSDRVPERAIREPESIEEAAKHGIRDAGTSLPYGDTLQAAFPKHRLKDLRVHVGSAASQAASRIGAKAYARGNDLVFADPSPDLFTVAHEAVHALQQQAGQRPSGSSGRAGDPLERQANEIARDIVGGRAPSMLPHSLAIASATPAATPALQLMSEAELQSLAERYSWEQVYRGLSWYKEHLGLSDEKPIASLISKNGLESAIQMVILRNYENKSWRQNTGFNDALRDKKSIHNEMNCYEFVISYSIQHGYITVDEAAMLYESSDPFSGIPLIWLQSGVLMKASEYSNCEYGDIIFFNAPAMHTAFSLGGNRILEFRGRRPTESTIEGTAHEYTTVNALTSFIHSTRSGMMNYLTEEEFSSDRKEALEAIQQSTDCNDALTNEAFMKMMTAFETKDLKGVGTVDDLRAYIEGQEVLSAYRDYLAPLLNVRVVRVPRATWIAQVKAQAKATDKQSSAGPKAETKDS